MCGHQRRVNPEQSLRRISTAPRRTAPQRRSAASSFDRSLAWDHGRSHHPGSRRSAWPAQATLMTAVGPAQATRGLDPWTRKLVGWSPPKRSAQVRTGIAVQCRPPWTPVVVGVGGQLGGQPGGMLDRQAGWGSGRQGHAGGGSPWPTPTAMTPRCTGTSIPTSPSSCGMASSGSTWTPATTTSTTTPPSATPPQPTRTPTRSTGARPTSTTTSSQPSRRPTPIPRPPPGNGRCPRSPRSRAALTAWIRGVATG
jgi:hypothetical protein